jgi:hypothetical protein
MSEYLDQRLSSSYWILELSDFGIEALSRGFQLDGDLDYLMHPSGTWIAVFYLVPR